MDIDVPLGKAMQYVVIGKQGDQESYSDTFDSKLPLLNQLPNTVNQFLTFGDFDESNAGNYTWNYLEKLYSDKKWDI
jgi:hypothetical protein